MGVLVGGGGGEEGRGMRTVNVPIRWTANFIIFIPANDASGAEHVRKPKFYTLLPANESETSSNKGKCTNHWSTMTIYSIS